MKRVSLIMALAFAAMMLFGISTAFAAGEGDGVTPAYGPDKNSYIDPLKGTGRASLGLTDDQNYPDLDATDAAFYDNANKTGWKALSKAVGGQTVHGQYKKNTNSCASCHMTHTAAGKSLLFRNGIYATCSACHDGSMAIYNVFTDAFALQDVVSANGTKTTIQGADIMKAGGGTFGGMTGASVHLATGSLKLYAAPGGNRTAREGTWNGDFTCAACHAPHGSYSDRLLHYSPNKVGSTKPKDGGYQKLVSFVADSTAAPAGSLVKDADGHYFIKKEAAGTAAKFDNRDKTPWLYGYDSRTMDRWTSVVKVREDGSYDMGGLFGWKAPNSAGVIEPNLWDSKLPVSWGKAYFMDPDGVMPEDTVLASAYKFVLSPALQVKFNMADVTEGPNASVAGYTYVVSYGTGSNDINKYCAACHTDYNQKIDYGTASNGIAQANAGVEAGKGSAQVLRGTFTQGFRHNITGRSANATLPGNVNQMSCLTCHYAHGTTQEIMLDATNQFAETTDVNPSSALKRYVNMGVCFKCHTSSHAITLKNNEGYWNQTDLNKYNGDGYAVYKIHEGYGTGTKSKWAK